MLAPSRLRSPATLTSVLLTATILLTCASCGQQPTKSPVVANKSSVSKVGIVAGKVPQLFTGAPGEIVTAPLSPRSERTGETMFEALTPEQSGVDFQLRLPDPIKNIKELMFLNPYGGIATGDFDGDGLVDFFVTSPTEGGRLYRNLGDMKFEDVTQKVGIQISNGFWGTGVTFADVNNDGRLDLYLCGYRVPNKLFINTVQQGTNKVFFEEQAEEFGLDYQGASMTMAFADIDNDGDLDAYLATTSQPPPSGTKFQVRFENGKPLVLDELKEYWELIYLPGDRAKRTEAGQYDHLYRNDGGHFTEITKAAGIDGPYFTLSATWWDYNQDNLPDLYVSNDFTGPDMLYENQGDGTFKNVIKEVIPHTPWFSMGADSGDLNNDGLMDLLAVDMSSTSHYREKMMMGNMEDSSWILDFAEPRQYMRNAVYLNAGVSRMRESAFLTGLASSDWTWNPRIADFDNDGRLDVFMTNGIARDGMNSDLAAQSRNDFEPGSTKWAEFWAAQPAFPEVNHAYRNQGDLKFEATAKAWGLDHKGVSYGAASADFDNDGDLDLVVNNVDEPLSVYRNNSSDGNRLRLTLIGTQSNRSGLGATVRLESNGLVQVRYVTLARGWLSACEPAMHFGLGDAEQIDRLTIQWPSGMTQVFTELEVNMQCVITEPSKETKTTDGQLANRKQTWFNKSDVVAGVSHTELPFDDFAAQPLLPNRLSRSGPAMTWADVDGDGHPDCFMGGCRGRAGQLFVSAENNDRLTPTLSRLFAQDAECEDVDALFFDADGDGDLDLYVVSGSNEAAVDDKSYADRLYFNDGKGGFTKANDKVLPNTRFSGSVVVAADVDGDGDQDLFVGSRCIPGHYPEVAASQLLINQDGKFTDKTPESLANVGLVTDAVWADVDGDKTLDLLVATEWGPVQLFTNDQGKLTNTTVTAGLATRTGWWTSLAAADVDGDGDIDFLATNFGLNTKYKASPEKPVLLYYGDVDGSGSNHIIEAKYEGNICYPRRGYSCSKTAMPRLTEKTKSFHEFAISSLAELYTDDRLTDALRLEVNELRSGVFVNDGSGRFEFKPLPRIAQIAPSLDACFADLNDDGQLDIAMAQNFFGPQRETGHMDGGVGLVLCGNGAGQFTPLSPSLSGIVVAGDARRVTALDMNNDGLVDVVFARNHGPAISFQQSPVAGLLQAQRVAETSYEERQ